MHMTIRHNVFFIFAIIILVQVFYIRLLWGNDTPFAVPVLTKEEAIHYNNKAMSSYIQKREVKEPFYSLYKNALFDTLFMEGTVKAVSDVPKPEENDYSDCLYSVFIELNSFNTPNSSLNRMSCEAILIIPVMKNCEIINQNVFLPGDKISCYCTEYDTMPQEIREIQVSDDIQSFEHQYFYCLTINRIWSFSSNGRKDFAKRQITFLPIQTLKEDSKASTLRKKRIANEIQRIEKELKQHGGSFESWKEEYKTTIGLRYKKLCSEGWKGWINESYFAAGGIETTYNTSQYIEGIMPYKKYLENNNIDLIVVRYPSKWDFAARVLTSDDFQENPAWIEHYYECLKHDIEIIDPMMEMWNKRFDFTEFYYYQVPGEIHPYNGYAFVTAQVLATCLERYSFKKDPCHYYLKDDITYASSRRDYYPDGNILFDSNSPMALQGVYKDNEKRHSCIDMSGSPILVVSNSLFLFPDRGKSACFPDYLAFHLGTSPDFIWQEGQTNSMLRSLVSNPTVLSKRKVIIMPGGYFMWNSFPPFPKYLFDNPRSITLEQTITFPDNYDSNQLSRNNEQFEISNKDGALVINKKGDQTSFSFPLNIPFIRNKRLCMIRVIFKKYNRVAIEVKNMKDDSIIEPECEADGYLKRSDLFVPVNNTTNVNLIFTFLGSSNISIDKIEFWYY